VKKAGVESYRDLLVWQKALKLATSLYEITRLFPTEERYGLTSQMRRAAVSVASNIAEGQARHKTNEFVQFLFIARGSLAELDTQRMISRDLGYLVAEQDKALQSGIDELQRMIRALIARLRDNALKNE